MKEAGKDPPADTNTNPLWKRIVSSAIAKAKPTRDARMLIAHVHAIAAHAQRDRAPGLGHAARLRHEAAQQMSAAAVTAFFFMLRPEEVTADGRPGGFPSLRASGLIFICRSTASSPNARRWTACDPDDAEVAAIYLKGRKTDTAGYGSMLPPVAGSRRTAAWSSCTPA